MKFATQLSWHLRSLTKEAQRRVQLQQQQQRQRKQQLRLRCRSVKQAPPHGSRHLGRVAWMATSNASGSSGSGSASRNRKTQLIRNTCTEFVAQMELLHSQLDKQPAKVLVKPTKEYPTQDGSFHQAMGPVLLVAEFFAIMPVKGVTAPHPLQLSFSWTYLRTWYVFIFTAMTIIDVGFCMNRTFRGKITFDTIEPLIFRLSILVVTINAVGLARKWPALMLHWWEVECELPAYTTQPEKRRLANKIKIVASVALMLSVVEHMLNINANIRQSSVCKLNNDPLDNFLTYINQHLFYVLAYSPYLAVWGKIINIFATFIWNYNDIFVMLVSIGLAAKFQQLNDNLMKYKGMQMPECFWSTRRIQYRRLCELGEYVDDAVSAITIISFSNNLYFICVQLLRSLNKMPSFAHALYFYYSLLFLIGRTLAVSLYSASIHDESRQPLRILRCVPKQSWCAEVKRFSEEINNDLVALSGMKFFYLTRKLVLSVVGTIVTYELVLIQFHQESKLGGCPTDLRVGKRQ